MRALRWLLYGPLATVASYFDAVVLRRTLSSRARKAVRWDVTRLRTRVIRKGRRLPTGDPELPRLHFGSGGKAVEGWLNVDVEGSDFDVDLAGGTLPWADDAFDAAVGQQVIEHLELHEQLLPLLKELGRVIRPGGELWVSCPDIEKICRAYVDGRMDALVEGRKRRFPQWRWGELPTSHLVNDFFHQGGEHKNLFDFELLEWALLKSGFGDVERKDEAALVGRFPGFPERGDDDHALYVRGYVPTP